MVLLSHFTDGKVSKEWYSHPAGLEPNRTLDLTHTFNHCTGWGGGSAFADWSVAAIVIGEGVPRGQKVTR